MRPFHRSAFASFGAIAVLNALPQPAQAQAAATLPIQQWEVPFPSGQPRDPFVAPDGRVFFVGQRGNYLGIFDPKTSEFSKHDLPSGTLPHTNIVTPDGIVWLAGNGNGTIVRFDPKSGATKVIPVPLEGAARNTDPHTMVYDGKGGIWFTSQQSQFVGHVDIASEKIRVVKMTDVAPRTNPYGIILDPAGHPWLDLFATNRIATIDPATMQVKTFVLPDGARPRRIARTNDGAIWYTDYARGFLGRLDPKTGHVEEFANPSGSGAQPYAMAVDDAERVWFVETGVRPNRMIAFDAKTKKVVYNAPIEMGDAANSVRHMVFDPKTRQIWFGADRNFLGAVKVPPKPAM
jgi:virginiamycin B lyase